MSKFVIDMTQKPLYADVILPLKLRDTFTYMVPEQLREAIVEGSRVTVNFSGRRYLATVSALRESAGEQPGVRFKEIESIAPLPPVTAREVEFWRRMADYYLCSVGEVYKCAYPTAFFRQVEKKRTVRRKEAEYDTDRLPTLSVAQQTSLDSIYDAYEQYDTVLLDGVTGSGKTEIYITLAGEALSGGHNVLYLLPEIALSRQLEGRLRKVFGRQLIVWHSKQTPATRKRFFDLISSGNEGPFIILGTRSAIFLPFKELSLVIVDEEHDSSYKQSDPAPRYNGRDAALMLASLHGAKRLLGSATPSAEALYNVASGKYKAVRLTERFFQGDPPQVTLIDMNSVYRLHNARGSFSQQLLNMIEATVGRGEQVMIFRARRAWSSFVQCPECGAVATCPHCNVSLSYHKHDNTLRCHYCGHVEHFTPTCSSCGKGSWVLRGAGTERLEEELAEIFPGYRIARFDSDTAAAGTAEKAILKDFEEGRTDILVGTQMISKGFDFKNLTLVAVINADSMFSLSDFRADERCCQMLRQLEGRAGRRGNTTRFVIQTFQKDHPVLTLFNGDYAAMILDQRRRFRFAPYVRMIAISMRDGDRQRLDSIANAVEAAICRSGVEDYAGPVAPVIERIRGEYVLMFWLKLERGRRLPQIKAALKANIEMAAESFRPAADITIDVDP